jgi:hypothetical protein
MTQKQAIKIGLWSVVHAKFDLDWVTQNYQKHFNDKTDIYFENKI